MSWITDLFDPKQREWEDFYRNRWSYDKIIRSTHGVNCTGGCSWNIYVKNGIVTWEMQALDYPIIDKDIPPYEPRGCQRGISYSWYIYSPIRVKYPYVRGALIDLWREAKQNFPMIRLQPGTQSFPIPNHARVITLHGAKADCADSVGMKRSRFSRLRTFTR